MRYVKRPVTVTCCTDSHYYYWPEFCCKGSLRPDLHFWPTMTHTTSLSRATWLTKEAQASSCGPTAWRIYWFPLVKVSLGTGMKHLLQIPEGEERRGCDSSEHNREGERSWAGIESGSLGLIKYWSWKIIEGREQLFQSTLFPNEETEAKEKQKWWSFSTSNR